MNKKAFTPVKCNQRLLFSKAKNFTGFTLIELLIVIGIIAILAAGVIVAINPGRQFAQARDATRESHINTLHNGLISYQVSNNGNLSGLPITTETTEICNTNLESYDCTGFIDLSTLVTDGHINQLPVDPQATGDGTGYSYEVAEGSIILVAPLAETRFIGIGITETEYTGGGGGEACSGFTYSPTGSWGSKIDTTVRDYYTVDNSDATVEKVIYCDDENCIFLTNGATAPSGDICVAESEGVYLSLLWDKTDVGEYEYGQHGDTLSSLSVVGGVHDSSLAIGVDNATEPAGNDWLDANYDTTSYTFPAMDACTSKGEGWRLPNLRELDSIRDQSNSSSPYTDLPGITSWGYWSSSEFENYYAYYLDFGYGFEYGNRKDYNEYVRCVRDQ